MRQLILASLLFVLAATGAPLLAGAQTVTTCPPGSYTDNTGACYPPITYGGTSGVSGSVNMFYLRNYAGTALMIINAYLVPLLVAVAFVVFLWGVYKYFIFGADNETERANGRQFVFWGIIGFAIIFSVWGLVNLAGWTLNLNQAGNIAPPAPRL